MMRNVAQWRVSIHFYGVYGGGREWIPKPDANLQTSLVIHCSGGDWIGNISLRGQWRWGDGWKSGQLVRSSARCCSRCDPLQKCLRPWRKVKEASTPKLSGWVSGAGGPKCRDSRQGQSDADIF